MGGTLSTHSTLGTWVRRESFLPVQNHFSTACLYRNCFGRVDRSQLFNTRGVGSTLHETTLFLHFSHELYCVWHTASFGSGMKTASAAPFWHLPVPGGTARWRMQAVWWLVWPKLFGPGARAIVEGWTPSGHTRLLPASRLTVAPGRCMYSQQSGQQSATLLRIRALPVPVDRLCLRLSSASGCAHRKNGDLRTFYALAASSYRHAT